MKVRWSLCVAVTIALSLSLSGCAVEQPLDKYVDVTGKVTYHGEPVNKGGIHFLPVEKGGLPATGDIIRGEIKNVTTRAQGDGVLPGSYKVAITAFEESESKRSTVSPGVIDPQEVQRAAENARTLIPPRYNNASDSGLTADVAPGHGVFNFELVD